MAGDKAPAVRLQVRVHTNVYLSDTSDSAVGHVGACVPKLVLVTCRDLQLSGPNLAHRLASAVFLSVYAETTRCAEGGQRFLTVYLLRARTVLEPCVGRTPAEAGCETTVGGVSDPGITSRCTDRFRAIIWVTCEPEFLMCEV